MSSPNQIGGALLAPPSTSRAPARNPQNVTQSTITIEPTPEYQRFYNLNRREMDRLRLEIHVAEENNLNPPPQAEPMSRSTTSESLPSPSTVYSHTGDGDASLSPDPTTEAARLRPHRGRRKGPLDIETRTKTAFKRKFKLTCSFHRAKRTSCNCHDFSKLEEGYRRFVAIEAQRDRARARSASRHDLSRTSYGDIGTLFGTGGAAPATPSRDLDLNELPISLQLPTRMRANLPTILDFDINSVASVNEMVLAPREQPLFLPSPAPQPILAQEASYLVPIGSSTMFRNRWQCEFQRPTEDTGSLASSDCCSWTGPFEQLSSHFGTEHHPFQPAEEPQWSMCASCRSISPGWVEEPACTTMPRCPPGSWRKWFYGAAARQPNPSPRMLTVSEASESGYSGPQDLSWNTNTPGSSNTERSNIQYNPSSGNSGFYEHLASGNKENNEAGDDKLKNDIDHVSRRLPPRYRRRFDATSAIHHCLASWLSLSTGKTEPRSTLYHSPLGLLYPSRSLWHLILSLLAPFMIFYLSEQHLLIKLWDILPAFLASIDVLNWCLPLVMLAPLTAWIATNSLRVGRNEEDSRSQDPKDGLSALILVV
ncbi:hypothetical protein HD806DRAFT_384070 [Xylariaceae sp. AK1471]|nr:hypothetical protein HD806DRAFT_384070 [Xylariaceae sp. AK1471]